MPTSISAVVRDVEMAACVVPFGIAQRVEALGVDPARHDRDRQFPPGRVFGLGGRVPAGGDDVAGPTERVRQRLLAQR